MRRVVFLDLDDTVFHSAHKGGEGELVATLSDGRPGSWMNRRQRAMFDWLAAGAEVVPTTGRNTAALERVYLSFAGWAITSFGGVILRPDRSVEPSWREAVGARVEPALLDALALAARDEPARVRARVVEDGGLPLYVSVKTEPGNEAALRPIRERLRGLAPTWQHHLAAHNLASMPPWLDKAHAVRWYRAHVAPPEHLAIGVGDSLSDLPFLAACDVAVTVAGSAIAARFGASS